AGAGPLVIKTDQKKRADAHQFPTHEHLKQVVRDDEVEHREAEEREEKEEPAVAAAAFETVLRARGVAAVVNRMAMRVSNGIGWVFRPGHALAVDLVVRHGLVRLVFHVAERE